MLYSRYHIRHANKQFRQKDHAYPVLCGASWRKAASESVEEKTELLLLRFRKMGFPCPEVGVKGACGA